MTLESTRLILKLSHFGYLSLERNHIRMTAILVIATRLVFVSVVLWSCNLYFVITVSV